VSKCVLFIFKFEPNFRSSPWSISSLLH